MIINSNIAFLFVNIHFITVINNQFSRILVYIFITLIEIITSSPASI